MELDPADAIALRHLEERLFRPEIRASEETLTELLAEDFLEIGSSGRRYDRRRIIELLRQEVGTCRRTVNEFEAKLLAPGVVLVTYRVTRHADGSEPDQKFYRSSIWRKSGDHWQMAFHQGTLVANDE